MASAPVLQALELLVTWLPSATLPQSLPETPLAMTCSTPVAPLPRPPPAPALSA